MKQKSKSILLIVAMFSLGACGSLDQLVPEQRLAQHLQSGNYFQALSLIESVSELHPAYDRIQAKKAVTIASLTQFENEVAHATRKYMKTQMWGEAYTTLSEALSIYPESKTLKLLQNEVEFNRIQAVSIIQRDAHINEAEFILKQEKHLQELTYLMPENQLTQVDYQALESRREYLKEQLLNYADRAINLKQYTSAKKYLMLVRQLGNSKKAEVLLQAIVRSKPQRHRRAVAPTKAVPAIQDQTKVQQDQAKAHRSQRVKELSDQLVLTLKKKNVLGAKRLLLKLQRISPRKELSHYEQQLLTIAAEQVQGKISEGESYYRQGRFSLALEKWREAQQMAPESEDIMVLILRAEKVMERLAEIEHRQSHQ